MKYVSIAALLVVVGCSHPTAPTPPPVVSVQPPAITPPVTVTPNPLLSDPRFNKAFYRELVTDGFEHPPGLQPLRRWTHAPLIYIRTIDDSGRAISPALLAQTSAAIINTTGQFTGTFGVAGLTQGTETREGIAGWITVKWVTSGVCGTVSAFGSDGMSITLNHARAECTCGPFVAKHELGHAMGFYHTGDPGDLMYPTPSAGTCDKALSAREIFHAHLAYTQPLGSLDPR